VTDWISQRASGSSWSGTGSNTGMSNGTTWNSWDPMSWQASDQSFATWYSGVEAYLDSNSAAWLLNWPPSATGNGNWGSGVSTGSVSNNNNANFTITINNASQAAAGTNECGQSNFVPPVGGMGGGLTSSHSTPANAPTHEVPQPPSQTGGTGGASTTGNYGQSPTSNPVGTVSPVQQTWTPMTGGEQPEMSYPPMGGSGSAGGSTISNTGQNSTNTITTTYSNTSTITNTNNVNVSNMNYQYAGSGDSSVSGNTSSGSAWSGAATNSNGSGFNAAVTN
jgi:hypothetical protein